MNRLTIFIALVLILPLTSKAQQIIELETTPGIKWVAKGGIGTSWLTFPKVFLVDPDNAENVWSISPATNNVTFDLGMQCVVPLGKHWLFLPEVNYSFLSGEVNVNRLETSQIARKLQTYSRISIPINFAITSKDNFWFAFGPSVFFTVADNKGFDNAVFELTSNANVNSDNPVGLSLRVLAAIELSDKMYIDFKFEYDTSRRFEFENDVYEVRMAMQSISVGVGYLFSKSN